MTFSMLGDLAPASPVTLQPDHTRRNSLIRPHLCCMLLGSAPASTQNASSSPDLPKSCSPGKSQLGCHFSHNAFTLGLQRGQLPLPAVSQTELHGNTCNCLLSFLIPTSAYPGMLRTNLEPETNLVLLIFDPPVSDTVSQHIVLTQMFNKLRCSTNQPAVQQALRLPWEAALFFWSDQPHTICSFFTRCY